MDNIKFMNKNDLIKYLAKRCSLTNQKSKEVVDNLLDIIINSLKRGEEINLVGFGKFWASYAKTSLKSMPQSIQKVLIPARFVPKFKCSKSLKRQFLL